MHHTACNLVNRVSSRFYGLTHAGIAQRLRSSNKFDIGRVPWARVLYKVRSGKTCSRVVCHQRRQHVSLLACCLKWCMPVMFKLLLCLICVCVWQCRSWGGRRWAWLQHWLCQAAVTAIGSHQPLTVMPNLWANLSKPRNYSCKQCKFLEAIGVWSLLLTANSMTVLVHCTIDWAKQAIARTFLSCNFMSSTCLHSVVFRYSWTVPIGSPWHAPRYFVHLTQHHAAVTFQAKVCCVSPTHLLQQHSSFAALLAAWDYLMHSRMCLMKSNLWLCSQLCDACSCGPDLWLWYVWSVKLCNQRYQRHSLSLQYSFLWN